MASRKSALKLVPEDNEAKSKALGAELSKMVKLHTKEIKSVGEKYGIILDVKVAISVMGE